MFELLGEHDVPYSEIAIFQVDERLVPDDHPDRNLALLRAHLPAAAFDRVRAMPVTAPDLEAAADRYSADLPEALDLAHLGLGADGHTASLVPGDPVLEVSDRRVSLTSSRYEGHRRMTLTYPALNSARQLFWLVSGQDKREAVARLLDGDRSIPAARVEAADTLLLASSEAAPPS